MKRTYKTFSADEIREAVRDAGIEMVRSLGLETVKFPEQMIKLDLCKGGDF